MNRRNYVAIVPYDPEAVQQGNFGPDSSVYGGKTNGAGGGAGAGRLSLAVDFMVQGEVGGQFAAATSASSATGPSAAAAGQVGGVVNKYGPVVVPSLEFGR